MTQDIEGLAQKAARKNLRSVAPVESQREVMGGATTRERGYFISSLAANAAEALQAGRGHRAIENQLHMCLEITFREDEGRVREAQAAERWAILRHLGMNLLQQEKSSQRSIKGRLG